jgi:hypothetical protein
MIVLEEAKVRQFRLSTIAIYHFWQEEYRNTDDTDWTDEHRFFSASQRNLDYFGHPVPCEAGLSVFIYLKTGYFIH